MAGMPSMLSAEDSLASVTPDSMLAQLYRSSRPPVELLPGLNLSAIVNSAWLPSDAKALVADLEKAKAELAETEAQISELKASFQEDPLSLVPWMQTLFDLVDAGLTTFEVGGPFFPHTALRSLFTSDNSTSSYESAEKVLGVFKKRCDRERGPGKVQVMARLVPNIFQDGYSASMIEPLVDKIRANVFGPDATDPLDFLQLYWWDPKEQDMLPTLKALQKLSEDKVEVNEETGETTITEPKKIRGIGFVDFPARSIISAIQAGVPVTAVQIPFSITNRSYAATLAVCRDYNIKVLARDGLMGGVISEKYLGRPCPETTKTDADLDEVAHSLDLINNFGGWDKVQAMLKTVKGIADKHKVKMQTVALRWQIDQGTFPIVPTRWGRQSWRQFGYDFWGGSTPGLDWQLFQVESFLDVEDMKALNTMASA